MRGKEAKVSERKNEEARQRRGCKVNVNEREEVGLEERYVYASGEVEEKQ